MTWCSFRSIQCWGNLQYEIAHNKSSHGPSPHWSKQPMTEIWIVAQKNWKRKKKIAATFNLPKCSLIIWWMFCWRARSARRKSSVSTVVQSHFRTLLMWDIVWYISSISKTSLANPKYASGINPNQTSLYGSQLKEGLVELYKKRMSIKSRDQKVYCTYRRRPRVAGQNHPRSE